MTTPHRWQKEIIAWANGEPIQFIHCGAWTDCTKNPSWDQKAVFRVKPEPVVRYANLQVIQLPEGMSIQSVWLGSERFPNDNLRFIIADNKITAVELIK